MTDQTTTIVMTDSPDADDIAMIADGLDEFNTIQAGINDRRPLAVLVRDPESNRVVGGLVGRTSLGLLFVDLFYLPAELRGSGIGSEILRRAEDEARERGCRTGVLYTINFQAPGFISETAGRYSAKSPAIHPGSPAFS